MSSSGSANGQALQANGTSSHGEVSPSVASFIPPNGFQRPTSSHPSNSYSHSYQPSHNEQIVNHLYHAFQTGNYADTTLHVQQHTYRLHAIILSRSPYLAHLMSTSPQTTGQRVIVANLEQEPEVTQEGFAIALGYLYSSVSLSLINPDNARAVLAGGCLLGGMEDLCQYAYEVCRRSLAVETIGAWIEFLDSMPKPQQSQSGASTPARPSTPSSATAPQIVLPTVFGAYAQRLRDDVFHFLVVTLPEILDVRQPQPQPDPASGSTGRDILLQVYAQIPFEMFKNAVESPTFNIGTDQARFKFAKDAIELRKNGIARGSEEIVVLAFGSNAASAVHLTRKMRKRPLWKVNS